MKLLEVTVSKSRKINTAQYENAEVFMALKAAVESTDVLPDAVRALQDEVDAAIHAAEAKARNGAEAASKPPPSTRGFH